jgi:UDP-N-acetylmuramate-alanine ligase
MTHPPARHISGLAAVADYLAAQVRPHDVVVIMGAGDSYKIGESLLTQLKVMRETPTVTRQARCVNDVFVG